MKRLSIPAVRRPPTRLRVAATSVVAAAFLAAGCSATKPGSPTAASLTVSIGSARFPVSSSSCMEQVTGSQHTLFLAGTLPGGRTLSVNIPLGTHGTADVVVAAAQYYGTSGSVTVGGNTFNESGTAGSGAVTGAINGAAVCGGTGGSGLIAFNNLTFALPGAHPTNTAPTNTAISPSTHLAFTVAFVADGISSASVVCLKQSVAAREFFFDIVGTTTTGKSLVFSGKFTNFTGPATYTAPPQGILFSYGGTPYAGVTGFRPESGSITVDSGDRSGTFNSLTIPDANPNSSGKVTVTGTFACTSYTTSP